MKRKLHAAFLSDQNMCKHPHVTFKTQQQTQDSSKTLRGVYIFQHKPQSGICSYGICSEHTCDMNDSERRVMAEVLTSCLLGYTDAHPLHAQPPRSGKPGQSAACQSGQARRRLSGGTGQTPCSPWLPAPGVPWPCHRLSLHQDW